MKIQSALFMTLPLEVQQQIAEHLSCSELLSPRETCSGATNFCDRSFTKHLERLRVGITESGLETLRLISTSRYSGTVKTLRVEYNCFDVQDMCKIANRNIRDVYIAAISYLNNILETA